MSGWWPERSARTLTTALLVLLLAPTAARGQLLDFVDWLDEGRGGPQLDAPFSVALSPDGASVYVVAYSAAALAVFHREPSSGTLTFVEQQFAGLAGVPEFAAMNSAIVTPDGASVYVTSALDDAVVLFQRDPSTGALHFVEATVVGSGGNDLDGARHLSVSPDGRHLYVGSARRVTQYHRDQTTGRLAYATAQPFANGVSAMTMSADGATLYVTGYITGGVDGELSVFRRDQQTGALQFVEAETEGENGVTGLLAPRDVVVSPDGAHVYIASSDTFGAIAVFGRDGVTGALSFVATESLVPEERALIGVSSLVMSPSGDHLYAIGSDPVVVFRRDATSGRLTLVEAEGDAVADDSPETRSRHLGISPDGRHVYAAGRLSVVDPMEPEAGPDGVAVFARDGDSGALSRVEAVLDGEGGVHGVPDIGASMVVSPDGANIYVGTLALRRDGSTGRLESISRLDRSFGAIVMSPDGANLYGLGARPSSNPFFLIPQLVVLARDTTTGATRVVSVLEDGVDDVRGIAAMTSITVSPDGRDVYVTSLTSGGGIFPRRQGGFLRFRREASNGDLRFVDIDPNLMGRAAVMSNDGGHLYILTTDDTIVILARDLSTGAMNLVDTYRGDDVVPAGNLSSVQSMALSPDSAFLYAAAVTDAPDDVITIFRRDSGSGTLTFVDSEPNAVDLGVTLAVSPDGRFVFTGNVTDRQVLPSDFGSLGLLRMFERDPVSGLLRLVATQEESAGVRGMLGLRALTISPDSAHVYAGGSGIAIFRIERDCPGDCNHDGMVSIAELVVGSTIAMERAPASACSAIDRNWNGAVSIDELVRAVAAALNDCE